MDAPVESVIKVGELAIQLVRKDVKNVHLSVHPPDGRVTLVAPRGTREDVARAYAISRLRWIERQQEVLRAQARETPRDFVTRESHFLWGRRYLLRVEEAPGKGRMTLDHKFMVMTIPPGSTAEGRARLMHEWHKTLLHQAVPPLIAKWEGILGVRVRRYFLQRMKTRWGSCRHELGHIRLNTELVKKPRDLLEYVVLHEMIHLIDPTHGAQFQALLDEHAPSWREARAELNELPLGTEHWSRVG